MNPLLNVAISAALSAGKIIVRSLDRLDTLRKIEKQKNDFVTEVDLQSEKEIMRILRKAYPDHAILAEESGRTEGDEHLWIIDPLDGTANFMHGFPHYSISIAHQYKNKLEVAVIYDPIRQEMFTALRGKGAHLNSNRRLRVNAQAGLEGSFLGTGFPYKHSDEVLRRYLATLQAVMSKTAGVRRAGSAALDLAYVAAGRLDGFWEFGLAPWDIAAGALLIKEAGGLISDPLGAETYLTSGDVVAGNPKVFKALLKALQPHVK